ncbi:hypothetical protein [Alteribacter lacisalsi]|uniref:hypothetical protein n=1 Tax=Alteribacter lacisalsi TaxID=2045244 RepID=UPI0013751B20|nr:hypothetical protein [Alteribacter lacisalsi]
MTSNNAEKENHKSMPEKLKPRSRKNTENLRHTRAKEQDLKFFAEIENRKSSGNYRPK